MGAATMAKFFADVDPVKRRTRWMAPWVTLAVRRLAVWLLEGCAFGFPSNWYSAQVPLVASASKTQTRNEDFLLGGDAARAAASGRGAIAEL